MQCQWIEPAPCDQGLVREIARELGIPQPLAEVLVCRGHSEAGTAGDYFDPKLKALSPPEKLPGILEAVGRLDLALQRNERIVLYGDYDVDGVTSLAFLSRILLNYGARVQCFLPLRAGEGYGLSEAGVERCCEEHDPSLVIAIDCGTTSVSEIRKLRERGKDVIVLDHHEPSTARPPAILVNPKADGEEWRYLCSAGVVFKLVHALLKFHPNPSIDLREYLDLVALGTVADMVPLIGENRILVRRGLMQLPVTRWAGLRALMDSAAVGFRPRGSDIGFRLGPRINASGRLGTALESLKLLTTEDTAEARILAAGLERQNRERQAVEKEVATEAEAHVSETFDPARDSTIVAGSASWHQGVLGIVASRIMRRHHRPTVVVGFDSEGMGKGSGRSVEGFSLVEALSRCGTLLEKFGGHELAAGLSIHQDRFEEFRRAFEEVARSSRSEAVLTPRLHLDGRMELGQIDEIFLEAQDRLEPFGTGNSQPVFLARAITPHSSPKVLKEKHVRLEFSSGRRRVPAIFFGGAMDPLPRPPWDLAFRVERNTYQGRDEPQIQVVAIRSAI